MSEIKRDPATVLTEAIDKRTRAWQAVNVARYATPKVAPGEWARLVREADMALDQTNSLQTECRDAFARSRGWRLNKKAWLIDYPCVDHAEFFDSPDKKRVGLVTHSYASKERLAEYAADHNLIAELLPFSWYSPGGCLAVVFTLKPNATWPKNHDEHIRAVWSKHG